MLQGLLVDLVPLNKPFRDLEHTWRNSHVMFWANGGDRPIVARALLAAEFAQWTDAKANGQDRRVLFGIQAKDGTPIGDVSLHSIVPFSGVAMLGAKIGDPAFWGGGYGTDALLLLADYAFDWLGLRKIGVLTSDFNVRVIRQMEKVGFTLEARRRQVTFAAGKWADWMIYGMLRNEWSGRSAMIEKLRLRGKE